MTESYSERHGRKPPIGVEALVELVFRKLRDFEQQGFFYEAFNSYTDPSGDEQAARLPRPEEYVITDLARPGLWAWLGDLERVVNEGDFPSWDLDTLFDVIELFHNLVVSAPMPDGDGGFDGWSQPEGQRLFRSAMNEVLALCNPLARLTDEGRIIELPLSHSEQPSDSRDEPPRYDVFISHAHEDKDAIARPLAQSLTDRGYRVFIDESELVAGDDLHERIADALASSRSGIVVLSPGFFASNWTRYELDALIKRESTDGSALIIPIWHGVDANQVRHFYPPLADRLALSTEAGLEAVVRGIERALQRAEDSPARVPAAGADEPGRAEGPPTNDAAKAKTHRIPIISWLRKRDGISIGDNIAIAVIGALLVAAVLGLPKVIAPSVPQHELKASPGTGTSKNPSAKGGDTQNVAPAPTSATVVEYADNHAGSPVFTNPEGTAVNGVPGRIPYGTRVYVRCVAPNESGGMSSVSGLYLIASGNWRNDYVVSDTMTNGGPVGTTTTPNIDPRVPRCH